MKRVILCVSLAFVGALTGLAQTLKTAARSPESAENSSKSRSQEIKIAGPLPAPDPNATEADLKIAFIGDVGHGANQQAVLRLIKSEGAQAVLHQGDFDYTNDPTAFWGSVDAVLGPNFPYFASIGNHDASNWPTTTN